MSLDKTACQIIHAIKQRNINTLDEMKVFLGKEICMMDPKYIKNSDVVHWLAPTVEKYSNVKLYDIILRISPDYAKAYNLCKTYEFWNEVVSQLIVQIALTKVVDLPGYQNFIINRGQDSM